MWPLGDGQLLRARNQIRTHFAAYVTNFTTARREAIKNWAGSVREVALQLATYTHLACCIYNAL
jgi:hypothetical protein